MSFPASVGYRPYDKGRRPLPVFGGSGGSGPPASFLLPYNFIEQPVGDSRTAQGVAITGTYGSGGGLTFNMGNGPDTMLGPYTGNKVRPMSIVVNAGGAAQSVEAILAYPRTGTNTVSLDQVAAMDAGIVILYMGTNDNSTANSIAPGGTSRVAITAAIAALTNPATNWVSSNGAYNAPLPLAGGKPKVVIIVNETPRGVETADTYTLNQNLSAAQGDIFEGWATWLMGFDWNSGVSGMANPAVWVVDAFHDAALLDPAHSGPLSSWLPFPGLFADGLHPSPTAVNVMGQIIAARIAPLLTTSPGFQEIPTVATAGSFLTPNPCFLAGTFASQNLNGATLTSSLIPSGTTIAFLTGTGGTGTYTLSNAPTASGTAVLTMAAGTQYTATVVSGNPVITVTSINSTPSIINGNTITGVILPGGTVLSIGTGATGLNVDVTVNTVDATVGNEIILHVTGTSTCTTVAVRQTITALSGIDLSTAFLRACANVKWTINNKNSAISIAPSLNYSIAGTGNGMTAGGPLTGSGLGYGNDPSLKLNLKNNWVDTSDSSYKTYCTGTSTLSNQGLPSGTHPQSGMTMRVNATFFANIAQDFIMGVRQMGVTVVSGVNG